MKCSEHVNGKSNVYGIIGNPIEHSFSPVLQNTLAQMIGHNNIYVPFKVEKDNLKKVAEGGYALGIKGFNVTVPHKKDIMNVIFDTDKNAQIIGAVNTLKYTEKGYVGYNTDIIGLGKCFEVKGIDIKNKNVVVLGAGGAANAAVVLAATEGAKTIYIINRTIPTAENLKSHILKYYNVDIEVMGYDQIINIENPEIVIQTTSLGMGDTAGNSPIKERNFFKKVKAVVDIIYSPWETKFLEDARSMGCIAINGFDMLVYQGIASYEIWNDIKIDNLHAEKIENNLANYYLSTKNKV